MNNEILKEKVNDLEFENEIEKGKNSRRKKILIEEAIEKCKDEDKCNRFKICEQLAYIMFENYVGKNLEYHSNRMGMGTTSKMLKEIDNYFYKDYKINQ